ncbi:MAG TPA: phospho-N-acetylmuramoyl-pentapeptide-transferase [Candidatus Cloacimonadota bacterium]|nr:phospho-N-acetylmuramoyl-pentapeptide-transferase [Candidatus Cloacimonadota bacterium]
MFYDLFAPLASSSIVFNVFRYITFRSAAAFITALLFTFLLGPWIIGILKKKQAVETIDEDVPERHRAKQGTPTMGGLIILFGLLLTSLLWNDLTNSYVWLMYLTTIWLGIFGFLDDYLKNFVKAKKGLVPRYKLMGQVSLALIVALAIYYGKPDHAALTTIQIPFMKDTFIQLGWFFIPFVVFMIVGTSNAVNLTDGLDGLAAGVIAFSVLALGIMAYIKGNFVLASYLRVEFISEAGELTVFTFALIGTILGFLWYNTYPAQVFMGDTGSLSLGGILALLSILLREQIFFLIVGLIFVFEALSVLIQRYYFKYTKKRTGQGRRAFRCAPVHHHYELGGLPEPKIVVRFWIIAALLAAVGLATLKLR